MFMRTRLARKIFLPVSVPLNIVVPLPLSTKLTPVGGAGFTLSAAVGVPAVVTVNVPAVPAAKLRKPLITRLGKRLYSKEITLRRDPRGGSYYWLAGSSVTSVFEPGSDVDAVAKGHISVTPLHIDVSDAPSIEALKSWRL